MVVMSVMRTPIGGSPNEDDMEDDAEEADNNNDDLDAMECGVLQWRTKLGCGRRGEGSGVGGDRVGKDDVFESSRQDDQGAGVNICRAASLALSHTVTSVGTLAITKPCPAQLHANSIGWWQ